MGAADPLLDLVLRGRTDHRSRRCSPGRGGPPRLAAGPGGDVDPPDPMVGVRVGRKGGSALVARGIVPLFDLDPSPTLVGTSHTAAGGCQKGRGTECGGVRTRSRRWRSRLQLWVWGPARLPANPRTAP